MRSAPAEFAARLLKLFTATTIASRSRARFRERPAQTSVLQPINGAWIGDLFVPEASYDLL
jgi:hypothetical protein